MRQNGYFYVTKYAYMLHVNVRACNMGLFNIIRHSKVVTLIWQLAIFNINNKLVITI